MHSEKGFGVIEILIVLFVVGMLAAGTVFAANSAVPGDLLFPLDLTIENIQEKFTNNEEAKLYLKIHQAEERIEEFERVRENGADYEIKLQAENNSIDALSEASQILNRNVQAFRENQPDSKEVDPNLNATERIREIYTRIDVQMKAEHGEDLIWESR